MRPKVFINIATGNIGGPGKGLLQFLRNGGLDISDPMIVGFSAHDRKGQFDLAMKKANVSYERLTQRMTCDPLLFPQAIRLFKKFKPDIVQSHGYKSHLICLFLKRMTGIPWIAFFHGWCSGSLKIKCYNNLEKVLLGFADKVVLVSHSMVEKLNLDWIDKEKIRTIPNAVDPVEFSTASVNNNIREKYGIKPDDPLLAVIGRLGPEKGHLFLINALPQIHKELPKLKAMLIGDGREKENLEKRIRQLCLDQSVIFTGFQTEIGSFYRTIDLLVLPSLSEGMPNVALEAMLYSKPVLATRVGGVPEVVLDNVTGRVVDPQNSDQLAAAVIKMFENPGQLLALGMAGRERVLKNFDPVQRVKKIAALYQDVLTLNNVR